MRRHGPSAGRISAEVSEIIAEAMWSLRVVREARAGAIVVAGMHGEVMRVDFVAIDKTFAMASYTPFKVPPKILARTGPNWVQKDLGDAPVTGHSMRDRALSAAPGPRARVDLRKTRRS